MCGMSFPAGDPALDERIIRELKDLWRGTETDQFSWVVETFTVESATRIDQIVAAAHGGDHEDMRRVAHSLKGSAFTVGALRLGEACDQIENWSSRGGEPDGEVLERLLDGLRTEFRRAAEALAKLRDSA